MEVNTVMEACALHQPVAVADVVSSVAPVDVIFSPAQTDAKDD